MQQEVILAMLAKEPSHGYELRARLRQALGPLGDAMNDGHVYVTLTRLEKAGLVTSEQAAGLPDRPDRKVYGLTPAGQERVTGWLAEVSWPKPDLAVFHLKLIAAAAAEPSGSAAGLLLEGIVLRLQADLRWLEACERNWTPRKDRS